MLLQSRRQITTFCRPLCHNINMWKLLVILVVIKLYARIDIFGLAYPSLMFDLKLGITQNMLCSVAYLLIIMKCTNALRGNCSLDAAITYTWNDIMYLFKGDKYARWTNDDTLGDINGSFFFLYCFHRSYYLLS